MVYPTHDLSQYEPTGAADSTDDRDPMTQLQIIRIPKDFRAKLAAARRERERRETGAASDSTAALTVVALLFLAALGLSFFTGLGATLLDSLPTLGRQIALAVAVAGAGFSVVWLLYALVRGDQDAQESHEI